MQSFIANLNDSIERSRRKVTVIYFNPKERDMFMAVGFVLTDELGHDIEIYRK